MTDCPPELLPRNNAELAEYLSVSRWAVLEWKRMGYKFEYGFRTTAAHCRVWLSANAEKLARRKHNREEDQHNPSREKKLRAEKAKLDRALSALAEA